MDVPADLEPGVQRADHDQRQAEIDVGGCPRLQAPRPRIDPPLPHAEQRQPDDEAKADGAERIAIPRPAIGAWLLVDQQIARDCSRAQRQRDPQPAIALVLEETDVIGIAPRLVLREPSRAAGFRRHHSASSVSLVKVRNLSGLTRMAAPVGQARTQAGPPSMPEHMSHLIACLGLAAPSFSAAFLRQL